MTCPVCKSSRKCKWVELDPHPEKLSDVELSKVLRHNISVIERGRSTKRLGEYNKLQTYIAELNRRDEEFEND